MKTLVIHHTAGNPKRPAQDDWKTAKGWYHWIIDGQGKLHTFKTNPNRRACGFTYDISFSGNFVTGKPTEAQIRTWQTFYLNNHFDRLITHHDLGLAGCATPSACPGHLMDYLPLEKDLLKRVNHVFRSVWGREPQPKESLYFQKRIAKDSIADEADLWAKAKWWYAMPRVFFIIEMQRWGCF